MLLRGRRRVAGPTAALIDRPRVTTTDCGGPRGDDGGKQVGGRKRPIAADVKGAPMGVEGHKTSGQDRDGVPALIVALLERTVPVRTLFAESA